MAVMHTEAEQAAQRVLEAFRIGVTDLQGSRYCSHCGSTGRLTVEPLNRRRPQSIKNSLLLCEECADHRQTRRQR